MNDTRPLCAGKHQLFDSVRPEDHELAAQLCEQCPLIRECAQRLADAQATTTPDTGPEGTWAGSLIGRNKDRRWNEPNLERERRLAQREFEDRAFDDNEARRAHASFARGDRTDWARIGHRVYDRRRQARVRAARARLRAAQIIKAAA